MKLEYWSKEIQHHFSHKTPNSRRAVMQKILETFEIRFVNCTFMYDVGAIHKMTESIKRESSIRSSIRKLKNLTLDLIEEEPSQIFTDCRFLIARDKEPIQLQMGKLKKTKFRFVACRFELRTMTFFEKIWNKIYLCFGPIFTYSKLNGGIIKIEESKIRLKDLPHILINTAERIAKSEENPNSN